MNKTIVVLCVCIPTLCNAQQPKFDFALSAPLYFRQAETYVDPFSHLFGAIGLDGVLRVNGTEETDMSFLFNAGFADDIRKFNVSTSTTVKNSLYFININPSVVVPSKWPRVQFCLGIGTLVRLGQSVSFSWGSSVPGPYTTTDSMNKFIDANSRTFMPYMSFGISKDLNRHFRFEGTIRPTLFNLYEPGSNINFYNNTGTSSGGTVLELNYQPIYVGVRLYYFFKEKRDD